MPVVFHEKVKMKDLLIAKETCFTFEHAWLEELELKMTPLEDTAQKQEKMIITLQQKEKQMIPLILFQVIWR